ncbi:hypothetical protein BRAS3843_1940022 [Bradyrhizobium sp. STM 3843]|uniref:hypothetical protein n=1 Tax=Bradyrhizobium sp. STM 3843 TaxID=551947 RepID=UPI000240B07E|nr:hypothetical protein [Bradyrhizobium sp. STM 3843]CCE07102.1 hypothetical protein BRAS3843_1940022 [Bradyrhizobium sp. STM 3843]
MRRRYHDWRSERDSRNWLAILVQTFDDVAESHASAKAVPTPEELRAQLLRPASPAVRVRSRRRMKMVQPIVN